MKFAFGRWVVAAMILALAASAFWGGQAGFLGMAMGLAATSITVGGWWLPIWVVGNRSRSDNPDGMQGTFWVVLTFLLKLPIFFILAFGARRIGGNAEPCFLWGLGLVYLALIGWALSNSVRTA